MTDRGVAYLSREALRLGSSGGSFVDELVVEEPLEIRVADDAIAVTMRTPGNDRELALGFLLSEGIIRDLADVGGVAHCGRPGDEGFGNVINVISAAGISLDVDASAASRRGTLTTASCGVCGRRTVQDLLARCAPVRSERVTCFAELEGYCRQMRERQLVFERTGASHGAAAWRVEGEGEVREDIGRHNAVDKVVGALLLSGGIPAQNVVLTVSGRISFEIVQKCAVAGIPIVASVSGVSSLAVDVARRAGISIVGFLRDGRGNVYAGGDRIAG